MIWTRRAGGPCSRATSKVSMSCALAPIALCIEAMCLSSSAWRDCWSVASCSASSRSSHCLASKAVRVICASCCAFARAIVRLVSSRACSFARRSSAVFCSCSSLSRSSTSLVRLSIASSCIFWSLCGAMYPRKTTFCTARPRVLTASTRLPYVPSELRCSDISLNCSNERAEQKPITSDETLLMMSAMGSLVASSIVSTERSWKKIISRTVSSASSAVRTFSTS
mmetsp:Transcript_3442/g.9215  ORF Transcript_3442/g.9215 Transcript_3442/m.9215 type:complete len:225 (+) Transcript_3442:622-1296(+)